MINNLKSQFGTTGVADTGAHVRVFEDLARLQRIFMLTPIGVPGPAGDEQLR